jgi:hypothetical protein
MASQKRVLWLNRVSRLAQAKRCGGAFEHDRSANES